MTKILVLGGGFAGVVAAESLAKRLGASHHVSLVSRSDQFVFYPSLVRLALGESNLEDVTFDLRKALLSRQVNFVEAEIARIHPAENKVIIAHGDLQGEMSYDFLIFALGRRLATERITGFYEFAHHLLDVEGAMKFGRAVRDFHKGRIVVGECPGARLPVPIYETAFALSRHFEKRRADVRITMVSPDPPQFQQRGNEFAAALKSALDSHQIEYLPDFPVDRVSAGVISAANGHSLRFKLAMLLPPFQGASAVSGLGITNGEGYINVEPTMRVHGFDNIYAAGDCVNFNGPKLGYMAVRQGEVAAENLVAQIEGRAPAATYDHKLSLVIDEGGSQSIHLTKRLWPDEPSHISQSDFWSWAKLIHDKYWQFVHS